MPLALTPRAPRAIPAARRMLLLLALAVAACAGRQGATAPPGPTAAPPPAPPAAPPSLGAAPDRFLTAGDVRIRYREIGRGEAVVLLHGFARTLEDWARSGVADSLGGAYRVIALDLRGFGRSTKFADPARYGAEMVDDIARLLGHLRVRRAHVVGHSMGALVAAQLALRHPDRVATLTLAAGNFRDSAATRRLLAPSIASIERGQGIAPLLAWLDPSLDDSTVAASSRRAMAENDSAAVLAVLRASDARIVTPARAARVRLPTLAIVGAADPLADDTRNLAEWWPETHLVVVDGASHASLLATPEFLARLRAHLRRPVAAAK